MTIDVERVRAETPGVASGIHLLACGSALMPRRVVDSLVDYTRLEAELGGYEAQAKEADRLAGAYDVIARHIGATAREIAIVDNATVAWCHAFYALSLTAGQRILTCEAEYAANYVAFLQRARRDGLTIDIVPSDAHGAMDVDRLEEMMDDRVGVIATTWIPTNGGLVNPAEAIGAVAKRHGVPFLLDACQAVGQMPVDVRRLNCDFLSATGRKFLRGPRGTGFLYVASKWLDDGIEPAMIDHFGADWVELDRYQLRDDARRFETWENAYALRAGLAAAVEYADEIGVAAIQERAWGLADTARTMLAEIPGCAIRDIGSQTCAIVSFTIDGIDPEPSVERLRDQGIAIGTSDPPSTLIDATKRNLGMIFRMAPHYYNTEDEIARAVEALQDLPRGG